MRPNWLTHIPRIILDQNWMQFSCTYYNFLWQREEAKSGESIVFLLCVGLQNLVFISVRAPSAIPMGIMGWPCSWLHLTCWYLGGAIFHYFASTLLIHLWYRTEITPDGGIIMEGKFKSTLEVSDSPYMHSAIITMIFYMFRVIVTLTMEKPSEVWSFLSFLRVTVSHMDIGNINMCGHMCDHMI